MYVCVLLANNLGIYIHDMNHETKELVDDAKHWTKMTIQTLERGDKQQMAIDYANIVSDKLDALQEALKTTPTKRASRTKKRSKSKGKKRKK